MTKSQEERLERLKREINREYSSDKYEVKRFEIEDYSAFISVYVSVGMIGDEGTLAEYICRDTVMLHIGKRGSMSAPVTKQLKNGKYKSYSKRYKRFLSACLDYWGR